MNIDKSGFRTEGKYSYLDLRGKYGVGGDEWLIPIGSFPNSGRGFRTLLKECNTFASTIIARQWDERFSPVLVTLGPDGQIRLCVGST